MQIGKVPKDITIPLQPCITLMRGVTNARVAEDAGLELLRVLESISRVIAQNAQEIANHAGRTTIIASDIRYVIEHDAVKPLPELKGELIKTFKSLPPKNKHNKTIRHTPRQGTPAPELDPNSLYYNKEWVKRYLSGADIIKKRRL